MYETKKINVSYDDHSHSGIVWLWLGGEYGD